ncbi:MAG: elongation factor 1-beta [Thermoprotei archaeon]|nr:MAG: elongation factor 1-beta [Thermoprotei archaeon]
MSGGRVLVVVKVYPESPEVSIEDLIERIKSVLPQNISLEKSEIEEIGFGIKILRAYIVMPEEYEGGTSDIENKLLGTEGVSQIEIEYVTRLPS